MGASKVWTKACRTTRLLAGSLALSPSATASGMKASRAVNVKVNVWGPGAAGRITLTAEPWGSSRSPWGPSARA